MRTKFNGILTLLLALVVQLSFAQDRTISGSVSDESGPLPGVTILKKGTTNGTETDFDGNYSIKAKTGDVLVYSFVGMKSTERTVGASNQVNITLETDNLLDEIVVVGYGTTTKKAYTGTAKVVKTENIKAKSFSNVTQSLAGEVAGVTVINTSGQPGSSSTVRIRGFGSVNGNRAPLYVVDGVPLTINVNRGGSDNNTVSAGSLNSINPEDIETTTVLKDATATAIYGARGANGVILITTKSGKKNSSSIEVDVKTGVNFQFIPRYDVIKSSDQYIGLSWEGLHNKGVISGQSNPIQYANDNLFNGVNGTDIGIDPSYNSWNVNNVSDLIDPVTRTVKSGVTRRYTPEDWADNSFQASIRTEANLKMSGGGEKGKYYTSIGYLDSKGYSVNSDYKRYSARINVTQDVKEWLTTNMNLGYAYSETNNNGQAQGLSSGNLFFIADNMPSIYPVFERAADGSKIPDAIFGGSLYDIGRGREFNGLTNGLADARNNINRTQNHDINGNMSFDVKLSDNLSFKTQAGIQHYNRDFDAYNNPFFGVGLATKGSLFKSFRESTTLNFLQMFTYNKDFGNHSLNALIAHESNSWEFSRATASKNKVVIPGLLELNNFITVLPSTSYTEESKLESYFAQVNYDYNDTYYLSASIRRDGSSKFIDENKWDTFGSIGASWIMSNEDFLKNQSVVNFLKLKASYGIVGEQDGVGLYPALTLHDINNNNNNISISEDFVGNPNLTWETSKMYQVGLESTFGNYLDVNVDYYIKDTENLLFDRRIGPSAGVAIQTVNDGVLRNSGLEFDIAAHLIKKEDFSLDFTVNGEILSNEMKAMPIEPATGLQKHLDIAGLYGRSVGHSLFDFYVPEWKGVDSTDGAPTWEAYYYDANNNGVFDEGVTGANSELVSSLTDYKHNFPNRTLSTTTTKDYTKATSKYVNKSVIPKVRGAFRLSATYKNFDFSSQFLYSLGGYSYDGSYARLMHSNVAGSNNWHKDIFNRWQKPGDITDVPAITHGENVTTTGAAKTYTRANSASTRFIQKSDYLALNNVRIGYSLPTKYLENSGISYVNIWASGDNLFLLSKRNGFNPTTSETGASGYRYSPLTNFSLGVRVKF